MDNFAGYEWGWITKDGKRQPSGQVTVITPEKIAGTWSVVKRSDIEGPFYHEIFLDEYKKSDKGSWGERPITKLLKLSRIQAFQLAYSDKTDNALDDEIIALPELFKKTTEKLQKWQCQACSHTFYTPLEEKVVWYRRWTQWILGLFGSSTCIECEVCTEVKAVRVKVVTKRIHQ